MRGIGKSRRSTTRTSPPASRAPPAAMASSFLFHEPSRAEPANARIFGAATSASDHRAGGRRRQQRFLERGLERGKTLVIRVPEDDLAHGLLRDLRALRVPAGRGVTERVAPAIEA